MYIHGIIKQRKCFCWLLVYYSIQNCFSFRLVYYRSLLRDCIVWVWLFVKSESCGTNHNRIIELKIFKLQATMKWTQPRFTMENYSIKLWKLKTDNPKSRKVEKWKSITKKSVENPIMLNKELFRFSLLIYKRGKVIHSLCDNLIYVPQQQPYTEICITKFKRHYHNPPPIKKNTLVRTEYKSRF